MKTKLIKRQEAEQRAIKRHNRSTEDQLALIKYRRGLSRMERQRLQGAK